MTGAEETYKVLMVVVSGLVAKSCLTLATPWSPSHYSSNTQLLPTSVLFLKLFFPKTFFCI